MRVVGMGLAIAIGLASGPGMAFGADAYAPLRLYQGTWRVKSGHGGDAAKATVLSNECARIGQFFGCQQTVDGKAEALILFLPYGKPGHYYTQAVTVEGRAMGRGDLEIEGSRWTYSSKSDDGGKQTWYRTTNEFSGTDRIHYEQAESSDGVKWVVKGAGDEERGGGGKK